MSTDPAAGAATSAGAAAHEPLFLDTAAAAPVRREALEAAWPYLTGSFGNASSHHEIGRASAEALKDARRRVAKVLGLRSTDITFTSGGTEADNLALLGISLGAHPVGSAPMSPPPRRHIIVSPLEHEAVLAAAAHLSRRHGFEVTEVEVDSTGIVTASALRRALRPDTLLVSLTYANNEVGTRADIPALAALAHEAGALLHTDAVQAAGWLPLSGLGADALTLAGHKIGAPKGIGIAAIRSRIPVEPLIHGGGQEAGRRSGTENVALAVAVARALELAEAERQEAAERVGAISADFIAEVLAAVPWSVLTGPAAGSDRTPNHASFCFTRTSGEAMLLELERLGVTASSGSACAVGSDEPSHVLTALGFDAETAKTGVRFTFPAATTAEQGRRAAQAVITAAQRLELSYA